MVKNTSTKKRTNAKKPAAKPSADFHPLRITIAVSAAAVASLFLLCLLIVL